MRADFYIVTDQSFQQCQTFACRLADKAYQQGHQITIQTESTLATNTLNELLWSFKPTSFIGHQIAHNQNNQIHIQRQASRADKLLLNLSMQIPTERWQRILQIVPNVPTLKSQARELYRQLQQQGYTINTHQMN